MTRVAIAVLVLCFAGSIWLGVDWSSPTARQLIDAGGNFGPKLLEGEWWRLVTGALLHAGPIHLLFNVAALYSAG
ncbi:MAG TPA: rhomboid family intramembrane serine protease, partial [Anaeromyxobacter sp.]